MMKHLPNMLRNVSRLLLMLVFTLTAGALMAQTSVQDFGTSAGTLGNNQNSTSFIPNPTDGTTYARRGNNTGGSLEMKTTGNPLGTTGAYLQSAAPTGGSVTKISPILDYTGSTQFYTSFTVMFGDASGGATATSGTWYFFQGDGASFSSASGFTGAQVFTGLKFAFGAGGAITVDYRNGSSWSSLTTLSSATVYNIEIMGNNASSGSISYSYAGNPQSVAAGKIDVYIDGALIGDDYSKGQLSAASTIKQTMFYGENSTGNVANIFLDDIVVYNSIPANIGTPANPPVITAPVATLTGNYGTAFSYFVDADGNPDSYAIDSGTLPGGLSLNSSTGEISGTPTATGFFSVDITATNGSGTSDPVTHDFDIDLGNQTISFAPLAAATYGDAPITLTATASSGLSVSYYSSNPFVATVSGDQVTILGAGTASITASQDGDANWNAASDVSHDLVVNKAAQTITFGALSDKLTTDAPFALTATASSGLTVSYSSSNTNIITISGNMATIVGDGLATITASQAGDDNYEAATSVDQDQMVIDASKSDQTISFGALSNVTYGDAPFNLTATATSGLDVTYSSSDNSVVSVSGSTVTIHGIGTATITASQDGDNDWNAAPDETQDITVDAKALTATGIVANNKVYDGTTSATFDVSGASLVGVVGGDDVSFGVSGSFASADAGNGVAVNYSVTLSGNDAGNYVYSGSTSTNADITQASQTISFGALNNKFTNDVPFVLNATASSGLTVSYTSSDPMVATVSGNTVTIVGAGTTTITASQIGDNNYSAATPVTQDLTVLTAPNEVFWDFGPDGSPTLNPSTGLPVANLSVSGIQQGNNYNASQNTTQINTSSKSPTNQGFSGDYNVSTTAYNGTGGSLDTDVNAYFEFTLTPAAGYEVTLSNITFGTRSTSTGPKQIAVRSSNDNYASDLGGADVSGNGTSWVLEDANLSSVTSSSPVTIRIYGYAGTGSLTSNSSANNWRLDDITIFVLMNQLPGCSGTPEAGSIASTTVDEFCAGNGVTLEANGYTSDETNGISYQWYSSTDGISFAPIQGETSATLNTGNLYETTYYYFEVTCANSNSSDQSNTLVITVNQVPSKPTISGNDAICGNGTTTLTSSAAPVGGSYQWYVDNVADGTLQSVNAGVGSWTVIITSAEGCISEASDAKIVTQSNLPSAPVVSGQVNVCTLIGNNTEATYSIAPDANATGYIWTLPPNVNVVSGMGTDELTVTFNTGFESQANKQLRVIATGACGNSTMTIYYLLAQKPGSVGNINGPADACGYLDGQTQAVYSVTAVDQADTYSWTVPAGVTIVSGQGTNSITVTFDNSFATSAITVNAQNGCGSSNTRSLTISRTLPSTPGVISGPANACMYMPSVANPQGVNATYRVTALNGYSYTWVLPSGVSLVSQYNDNNDNVAEVSIAGSYTSGNIGVKATNGCGESAVRYFTLRKNMPSTPSGIDVQATQDECPNRVYKYSLTAMPAQATSVEWTVPAGGTITSGQGTVTITVSYADMSIVGNVTAVANNGCGNSAVRSIKVKLPECSFAERNVPAGTISGVETEVLEAGIFPNPSANEFRMKVKGAAKEKMTIRVYDVTGRAYDNITANPGETISFGNRLKPGTYMVEVISGTQRTVTRIVKL